MKGTPDELKSTVHLVSVPVYEKISLINIVQYLDTYILVVFLSVYTRDDHNRLAQAHGTGQQ